MFSIHSDGCGRTGAYLCIDSNLEFCDEDNTFDVFGYTKKMRQSRKGMVEAMVSPINRNFKMNKLLTSFSIIVDRLKNCLKLKLNSTQLQLIHFQRSEVRFAMKQFILIVTMIEMLYDDNDNLLEFCVDVY